MNITNNPAPPLRLPFLRTIKNHLDASSAGLSLLNVTYHTVKFGQLIQINWIPYLSEASTILNTAKIVIAPLKGLKSIDWWINGGETSWKWTALNCIGVVATFFNSLKFINRFKLMDLSLIQKSCAAVPYFGILPYAGLSSLTSLLLLGSTGLIQLDKRAKYHTELQNVYDKTNEQKQAINYKLIANNLAIAQKALFIFSLSFSLLTPFTGLFALSAALEKGCTAAAVLGLGLPKLYLKYKASTIAA